MSTTQSTVTALSAGDVLAVVRGAVATVLERDVTTVAPSGNLSEMGLDSLGRVAVAEIIEEHFAGGLQIPDGALDRFVTVADAVEFVRQQLGPERRN